MGECKELQSFYSTPRQYSAELLALCEHVRIAPKCKIGFNACLNSHFSAYHHGSTCYADLEHGDSRHQPHVSDILEIFQWIFSGVIDDEHIPWRVKTDLGARQGMGNGGDGSCGIASHNFSE